MIEAKNKPSYPMGVLTFDAIGKRFLYDSSHRKRFENIIKIKNRVVKNIDL
ncbi:MULTISPECIES: hypothetical protein [unclassified Sedimentibacter]|uniref:hypothetical protein n=1 Tax=unclassified Sedimentibacter TaxID=2649220 RepID=UPI0027E0BEE5|nr:hypothetical protein [Sedimentibacter sp. MB35-C1]WMJ77525.1 hypothetical protein RBQ61_00930 [Sedimentibacter sp. MB35-C1]